MAYTKLRELTPMEGQLETITMMELRKQPGEILDSVIFGKTFILTKQGKPCAVLTRLPGQTLSIIVDRKGNMSYSL
jgi:antitoxin (DNA-binding transcriptional repressor) of toxin-antitoxin stability system